SEKVERVYAEGCAGPLGAAVVFLVADMLIGEGPRRKRASGARALPGGGGGAMNVSGVRLALSAALLVLLPLFPACAWDPSRPFDRDAPQVREAIVQL